MDDGPFHAGELAAQRLAGGGASGGAIRTWMPDQHRTFFAQLPFVVVATTDAAGPVATLWTGAPGFVTSPDPQTLHLAVARPPLDPTSAAFVPGAELGLLGLEPATKRRNRANGTIVRATEDLVTVAVRQSFGNCPQHITPRPIARAAAQASPAQELAALDEQARSALAIADTLFVASAAHTEAATGGVDVSHRGGPPGFAQVRGDVITIPDYRGNRYFNTLGNLLVDPRAAILVVDFARGDALTLQGTTEIVWDGPELAEHAGAVRLWRLRVARAWRRPAAYRFAAT